jgi:hypothetical protein
MRLARSRLSDAVPVSWSVSAQSAFVAMTVLMRRLDWTATSSEATERAALDDAAVAHASDLPPRAPTWPVSTFPD